MTGVIPHTKVPSDHELLTQLPDRLTPMDISLLIASKQFYHFPGTTTTICALTLINGFTVTGESSCISVAFFSEEMGQKVSLDKAIQKIWELEAYRILSSRRVLSIELEAAEADEGDEA